jgi:hypothetical protein
MMLEGTPVRCGVNWLRVQSVGCVGVRRVCCSAESIRIRLAQLTSVGRVVFRFFLPDTLITNPRLTRISSVILKKLF